MMKKNAYTLLFVGSFALLGAGCASSPPTMGEKMISQSKGTKDLGAQWERGEKLVAKGEKIRADGMDIIAKGEDRLKEGDRLVAEGQAMMKESELVFQERFRGIKPEQQPK